MARAASAFPSPDEWKLQTFQTLARSDREVLAALKVAQKDVNASIKALDGRLGFSADVRRAQLHLAKRNIQARMARLWTEVGDIAAARRLEAANRIIDVQKQLDTFMLTRAGLADGADIAASFADSMKATAESGLDRMEARLFGSSYTPLSQRVYNSNVKINSQLDRAVNSALAQALSAKEFATAISFFINPQTPGGLRYASMRLARTEINNSAHAIAVQSVQDHPWVETMSWHLSGSHPHVDICNELARGGPKGDGKYPKAIVPAKPHPHCFCYVVPDMPSEEEFLDNMLAGHYDKFLERYRGETKLVGEAPAIVKPATEPIPKKRAAPKAKEAPAAPVKPVTPASAGARVSTGSASGLAERLDSGIASRKVLGKGVQGTAELVQLNDGSKAVIKVSKLKSKLRPGGEVSDAEELASLVGKRLGVKVPEVVRQNENTIAMEHMDGMMTIDRRAKKLSVTYDDTASLRSGLFDFAIGNVDRNGANFLLNDDGIPSLIDHGMAFKFENQLYFRQAMLNGPGAGFARLLSGEIPEGGWIGPSTLYSKADLDHIRSVVESLRGEFERLNKVDWLEGSLSNIDFLQQYAKGTGRVFG